MQNAGVDADAAIRVAVVLVAVCAGGLGCSGGSTGGGGGTSADADVSEADADVSAIEGEDADATGSPTDTGVPDDTDETADTDGSVVDTSESDTGAGGSDTDAGAPGDSGAADAELASDVNADTASGGAGDVRVGSSDFETVDCASASAAASVQVGPRYAFSPPQVTIRTGEVVQWTWASTVTLQHNVTADDDGSCGNPNPSWFQSTTSAARGTTFCVRFEKTGTWNYHCTVRSHCSRGMSGSVEVN